MVIIMVTKYRNLIKFDDRINILVAKKRKLGIFGCPAIAVPLPPR
jgi:hypothetical protein